MVLLIGSCERVSVLSMAHWTTEKTEELIGLYEARSCLYNTKLKIYFNRDARQKAIEEIAGARVVPRCAIIRSSYNTNYICADHNWKEMKFETQCMCIYCLLQSQK